MSTAHTAASDVLGSAIQATPLSTTWILIRMSLKTPKMSLYIHFHIWAATTVGIAHGTSITARITATLETGIHDERDDQTQHELEGDRDGRELDRQPDGIAEERVVEQRAIVVQPDEFDWLQPGQELLVREALPDRQPERIDRDKRDDRERRDEHHPRQARLLSPEATRPAASGSRWERCVCSLMGPIRGIGARAPIPLVRVSG